MDLSTLSDTDLNSAIQALTPQAPRGPGADLSKLSDADLQKAIDAATPKAEASSSLAGAAKSYGVGVGEGLINTAGLPADLANAAAKGIDWMRGTNLQRFTQPVANAIGGENLQKIVERETGPFYQSQGPLEKYLRTAGQFTIAAAGGPEGLGARLATRVAAPAIASETAGQLTQGTPLETPARIGAAVVGAGLPTSISRIISPVTAKNAEAVSTLENAGVTALSAGQKTGNRAVQYAESHLSEIPGGGGGAPKLNELAHEQYTAAVARPAGIKASRITPEVLDQAFTNTGAKFDAIAQAAGEIPLGNFTTTGKTVLKDYANLTREESSVLQGFYDRITNPAPEVSVAAQVNPNAAFTKMSASEFRAMQSGVGQAASTISGDTYQALRSQMLAKARQTSNPELKLALGDMRNALDESVQKGLPPKLADAWLGARQEYKNLLIVEKALNRGGEFAPNGLITPAALRQAASSIEKRGFTRGQSNYTALAKAGEAVLKTPPQSGTAPRMTAHLIPSAIGGIAGGLLGGSVSIPAVTGLIAPALTGRAMMSGLGQRYLGNQFAVPLRQIPLGTSAVTGGLLGFEHPNQP